MWEEILEDLSESGLSCPINKAVDVDLIFMYYKNLSLYTN